jgi:hypothetical protein
MADITTLEYTKNYTYAMTQPQARRCRQCSGPSLVQAVLRNTLNGSYKITLLDYASLDIFALLSLKRHRMGMLRNSWHIDSLCGYIFIVSTSYSVTIRKTGQKGAEESLGLKGEDLWYSFLCARLQCSPASLG